jgi:hypothetical protein
MIEASNENENENENYCCTIFYINFCLTFFFFFFKENDMKKIKINYHIDKIWTKFMSCITIISCNENRDATQIKG